MSVRSNRQITKTRLQQAATYLFLWPFSHKNGHSELIQVATCCGINSVLHKRKRGPFIKPGPFVYRTG